MANVIIKYYGPACLRDERVVRPICPVMLPCNSYADSDVMVNGNEEAGYGKSIYATNVHGFGSIIEGVSAPMLNLPFPGGFKAVNMAIVGEEKTDDAGKTYRELSIEVTDYKEVLYFKELAAHVAPDFEITVDDGAAEEDAAEEDAPVGEDA